jgi:hypothetical protein
MPACDSQNLCTAWNACLTPECGGDPSTSFAYLYEAAKAQAGAATNRACVFVDDRFDLIFRSYPAEVPCVDTAEAQIPGLYVWEDLGFVASVNAPALLSRYQRTLFG